MRLLKNQELTCWYFFIYILSTLSLFNLKLENKNYSKKVRTEYISFDVAYSTLRERDKKEGLVV